METAAVSGSADLAEGLLRYFVDHQEKECFAACLYTCFEFIRPDVVLELSWRNNLIDFAMPFMIQTFRQYENRIADLEVVNKTKDAQDKETKEQEDSDQRELMQ
eukprot:TRINITY_DN2597_c0_g1_i1.p2 TRINITY_DN2597_c0_g1~~TRINITY_DN2597_c0_g1_i1.p2  ORF type:complete len:120 (-),score=26.10 TRINITY_DN2597_c0_g1_i1:311-622(-)